jgi:hypothetical protein
MKRALRIVIDCGDKTCVAEPGNFCPALKTFKMGTIWLCSIFNKEPLEIEAEGWLQRLPECLAAEEEAALPPCADDCGSTGTAKERGCDACDMRDEESSDAEKATSKTHDEGHQE